MHANLQKRLLEHYRLTARRLPWRTPPGAAVSPDPYHIWLSEVMLQQTTVATVGPRFERFVRKWPQIEDLAATSLDAVLAEWAGLGYYARARNLHACAVEVARLGAFPADEEELKRLPGIGDYTAAAIAAIAFGRESVPVDTNVERVVARLEAIDGPIVRTRPRVREAARWLWSKDRPGDFAQAMMDLGATICRPRDPDCDRCPLRTDCKAYASGNLEHYPAPKVRKVRPERIGTAWWTERDGAVWLVRREPEGMLGGMAALPGNVWSEGTFDDAPDHAVRHLFTHFALTLSIEKCRNPQGDGWWQPLATLVDAGLPTLYRKAATLMRGEHS